MRYTEYFFEKRPMHATSWVDRWSTVEPGVKADMIETGHGPGQIAVDENAIWIANATSKTVSRIDRRTARVECRTELDHPAVAIAAGTEAVWVLGENGWLWRFHPDGQGEGVARTGRGARDLVCDRGSTWVLQSDGELVAVDQVTGENTVESRIPRGGRQIFHHDDALIALTGGGDRVCRIETEGGTVEAQGELPAAGTRATLLGSALWVACSRFRSTRWGALVRVDLGTMTPEAVHELPNAPRAITAGGDGVWVACGRRGDKASTIVRVEPTSGEMIPWAETAWTVHDLAFAGDELAAACGMRIAIDVAPG
ncbi:MAG TPA: hypothetical protein VHZ54_09425 [Solirubrobacterales bacterium]|jgi:hypothetical protein|nr:hypothetical protein [Solirubrobacterales bacterium]